jgi:hypothetical protein
MLRLEVELKTDAALCAAVPDEPAPAVIPEAPAFHPCADVGILDEQLRWVIAVRKP